MKVRNRLVNFRVTDEELQRLKIASALRNARCFSDFVRSAALAPDGGSDDALDPDAQSSFDRRLVQLESAVGRLIESVDMFAVKPQK